MALVRQLTTAGFRPKSKYEYIVPRLSKCPIYLATAANDAFFVIVTVTPGIFVVV